MFTVMVTFGHGVIAFVEAENLQRTRDMLDRIPLLNGYEFTIYVAM